MKIHKYLLFCELAKFSFNVHALLLNQNNKNIAHFVKFLDLLFQASSCMSVYSCLFWLFPSGFLALSCKLSRHHIMPVLLLKTQKSAIPRPAGQQRRASRNPNWIGVKDNDSAFHFICRNGLTLGTHVVPSALLPWSIRLCKWKPQQGRAGDRVGKARKNVEVQEWVGDYINGSQ